MQGTGALGEQKRRGEGAMPSRSGFPGTLLTDKGRGLQGADKPMSLSAAQAARGFCEGPGAQQAVREACGERMTQRLRGG